MSGIFIAVHSCQISRFHGLCDKCIYTALKGHFVMLVVAETSSHPF